MTVQVYMRKDWGAAKPKRQPEDLPDQAITELVIHYSGMAAEARDNHAECAGVVRAIQRYHQSPGWSGLPEGGNDIAYNWLTCKHGGVYEGRGWGVYPAATLNHNYHTQAVCFVGGDKAGRDDVTPAGREALTYAVREFHRLIGAGKGVVGHRDRVQTACPGDELYAWIRAEGWRVADPVKKPWPIPVPAWFWPWAKWRRSVFNYPSHAAWRDARPPSAPARIPEWAWVRLAAMSPKA